MRTSDIIGDIRKQVKQIIAEYGDVPGEGLADVAKRLNGLRRKFQMEEQNGRTSSNQRRTDHNAGTRSDTRRHGGQGQGDPNSKSYRERDSASSAPYCHK